MLLGGRGRAYLWVVPPDVREKLVNKSAHQRTRSVDSSNELRDYLVLGDKRR